MKNTIKGPSIEAMVIYPPSRGGIKYERVKDNGHDLGGAWYITYKRKWMYVLYAEKDAVTDQDILVPWEPPIIGETSPIDLYDATATFGSNVPIMFQVQQSLLDKFNKWLGVGAIGLLMLFVIVLMSEIQGG